MSSTRDDGLPKDGANPSLEKKQDPTIVRSLSILDPILQFLTKATGQTLVPFANLQATLPALSRVVPFADFCQLVRFGILRVETLQKGGEEATLEIAESNPETKNDDWQKLLKVQWDKSSSKSAKRFHIGFPSGDANKKLCGSTKVAAKRRLAALKRCLKEEEKQQKSKGKAKKNNANGKTSQDSAETSLEAHNDDCEEKEASLDMESTQRNNKDWTLPSNDNVEETSTEEPLLKAEQEARMAFHSVLGLSYERRNSNGSSHQNSSPSENSSIWRKRNKKDDIFAPSSASSSSSFSPTPIVSSILPKQLSYAGTHAAQTAQYEHSILSRDRDDTDGDTNLKDVLHPVIAGAFNLALEPCHQGRRLYRHQALAIASVLKDDRHTLVCTGTGSGKSLCFLIPVLQAAFTKDHKSLVLFPTKALAQDQLVKLQALLEANPELAERVCAAALDGDTPHSQRTLIAETCNVVFTNPDTLHASILPNWKTKYRTLLKHLKYVVVDEAHMYEGVFGAHVAMILARLYRIHCVCARLSIDDKQGDDDSVSSSSSFGKNDETNCGQSVSSSETSSLVFLACSATLAHPQHHFRLLCCIPSAQPVTVLTEDFSPRAAKHFFVWNPPLLDENGKSLGYVSWPKKKKSKKKENNPEPTNVSLPSTDTKVGATTQYRRHEVRRRHSADETALLLARAVTKGVRCIAFCKTRCLVEWVYDKCIKVLKQSKETAHLISKVDSYRGGYSKLKRREIEEKLFHNQLLGVVGTSALELGVDIGGVGLTLHCGFPSSHASLMQQAGRAGRGAAASHQPSLAICVCFNSPIDQHLWRHPKSLLSRGLSAPLSMPIYPGLVQGHLICAGNEFPLTGQSNTSAIQSVEEEPIESLLSDEDLFGSSEVYREAMEILESKGSFQCEKLAVFGGKFIHAYTTHPSIKNPWKDVSIRCIETVNYDIVDISHPMQGNRMDGSHHEAAILDNIPYSRVFYHAFPGAIITHRGRRYKIVSMTRPPAFGYGFTNTVTLGAYAKPSTHRYCTRPLSNLKITVVKQMERVDLVNSKAVIPNEPSPTPDPTTIFNQDEDVASGSFAGCGMITVKRNVHGYKKVSLVTRDELSRSELSLPDMEYDTFAFWIDCDASGLGKLMTPNGFGYGVHALSHALCNVAPLFVPCVIDDVQCDHSFRNPTRVVIFDSRAGGSGITAQLWKTIFQPKGLVQAAIDLLSSCPSCSDDSGYTGGCPACIQVGECIKFNDFLCRKSALIIAKHMLQRMEKTELYKTNLKAEVEQENLMFSGEDSDGNNKRTSSVAFASPRREKRKRAMRAAMDMDVGKQRQLVIGRPSWPMDRSDGVPRQQQEA